MCNCVLLRVSLFFVLVSGWCVCAHVLPVTLLAHPTLHKNAGLWSATHSGESDLPNFPPQKKILQQRGLNNPKASFHSSANKREKKKKKWR